MGVQLKFYNTYQYIVKWYGFKGKAARPLIITRNAPSNLHFYKLQNSSCNLYLHTGIGLNLRSIWSKERGHIELTIANYAYEPQAPWILTCPMCALPFSYKGRKNPENQSNFSEQNVSENHSFIGGEKNREFIKNDQFKWSWPTDDRERFIVGYWWCI